MVSWISKKYNWNKLLVVVDVLEVVGLIALLMFLVLDDMTGIGIADDPAIPGILALLLKTLNNIKPGLASCLK